MNNLLETLPQDCCCLCESYYWTTQTPNRDARNLAPDNIDPIPATPLAWLAVGALGSVSEGERSSQPISKT
ncbi:hypothetical protein [Oscillatoria sp. FACHB-1406]|uniref:hypothetical protein n=1 Tax=Oscillatoria sp. FACHB-1406 TaxID=2692846 RepID=UPI0016847E0E|nr:hypothetical protein [Oscillatoria sp. FACHB-1406]MBD2578838.1 hypothetical protein [Oscillatoria sp. FACHB-1406]